MYKHIDLITKKPEFYEKPWVFLGTGPSLDNFKQEDYPDHNILAIYVASQICDATIHWCAEPIAYNDLHSIYPKMYTHPRPAKYLVTRWINYNPIHEAHYYPTESDRAYPIGWDTYPNLCSAATAMMFLGKSGIERVKLFGVDGGIGKTSARMPEKYRESHEHRKTNFDEEVLELTIIAERYKIKLS